MQIFVQALCKLCAKLPLYKKPVILKLNPRIIGRVKGRVLSKGLVFGAKLSKDKVQG